MNLQLSWKLKQKRSQEVYKDKPEERAWQEIFVSLKILRDGSGDLRDRELKALEDKCISMYNAWNWDMQKERQ